MSLCRRKTDRCKLQLNATGENTQFLLAQYNALRDETMERLKELWQLEKFALGGAAAIASWVLAKSDRATPDLAWWLPLVLVVICLVRFSCGMYHLACRASRYLKAIEKAFLSDGDGWESWFRRQRSNETIAFILVWGLLLAATITFPSMRDRILAGTEQKGNVVSLQIKDSGTTLRIIPTPKEGAPSPPTGTPVDHQK